MVINLPDNEVFLYGNASSDDKGIASYEWISKSENINADINVSGWVEQFVLTV